MGKSDLVTQRAVLAEWLTRNKKSCVEYQAASRILRRYGSYSAWGRKPVYQAFQREEQKRRKKLADRLRVLRTKPRHRLAWARYYMRERETKIKQIQELDRKIREYVEPVPRFFCGLEMATITEKTPNETECVIREELRKVRANLRSAREKVRQARKKNDQTAAHDGRSDVYRLCLKRDLLKEQLEAVQKHASER